jgi:small-conductance mechanosensitive channel
MDFYSHVAAWVKSSQAVNNFVSSVVLFIAISFLRSFALRSVREMNAAPEVRRKLMVQVRNGALLLMIIGLLLIWGTELKTFAVSLVAIAAALVIATRELLLCLLGGLLRASTKMFEIGDRVEIGDFRGDVINHNFLSTSLNEIGPGKELHQFTGRILTIPNSLFFSQPLINESATGPFVLHTFRVAFKRSEDWKNHERLLLDSARKECSAYLADAMKQFEQFSREEGLEVPNIEPRISRVLRDAETVELVIRIVVPARRKGRIEQAIIHRYFDGTSAGQL